MSARRAHPRGAGHPKDGGHPKDAGYVIALFALLLLPLMVVVGFAVDLGFWYTQATREQRAADAAALAGVVWLPDVAKATSVAQDTAARNGFDDADPDVVVVVTPLVGQRLQVRIDDSAALFFSSVVLGDFDIARQAVAEYILPPPLGSPRNFIGTGVVGNASMPPDGEENLMLSINGYCTDRVQGDRIASRYNTSSCSGAQNADYRASNYEFYVDLPATRSYATDVLIFDATYRSNSSTDCYNPSEQYDRACDFNPGGQSQPEMSTTYTLYNVDATPLDDADNPTMQASSACSSTGVGHLGTRTFSPDDTGANDNDVTFNPGGVDGSNNWWRLCTIPQSAPGGRYRLQVTNQDASAGVDSTQGSNNFGVVATPVSPQRICDARTDPTCPKVYARDNLSIRLLGGGTFFLAEIDPRQAGKKVQVELWDAAEGATRIRMMEPTGANTWAPIEFDWSATNGQSGNDVTQIDLSSNQFNSHLLTIEWTLPVTYSPPAGNAWWRIEMTAGATVTDRTTWSVRVFGDPVHLVE
jgi:hypothetical protein